MKKMPRRRDLVDRALTLAGIVVVLFPVLLFADSGLQVAVVVAGLLMVEAGVWGLARQLGPDARTYTRLRSEVDAFVETVRELNGRAVEGDRAGVEALGKDLHERVDAIVDVAGKEDGEAAAEEDAPAVGGDRPGPEVS